MSPQLIRAVMALLALATTGLVTACGGKSSSSPTAPSSGTSSVAVTVASPIRMGQTTQASGTATLSNGQTQSLTTGWQSDQPGIAAVTTTGVVSGISNGRATIFVISGGRQGQQVVRIVPDYQGRWSGVARVRTCAQTGLFAQIAFCDEFPLNTPFGFVLQLSQSGELMTANLATDAGSQAVAAPVLADGSSVFNATFIDTSEGFAITLDTSWQLNSSRVGELTGTVADIFRVPGVTGEGRLTYDIVSVTRTSTSEHGGNGALRRTRRALDRMKGAAR